VAQATLAEGAVALVVDPSGPVPFAVGDAELRALALADDPTAAAHEDPLVVAAVGVVCAREPAVISARTEPGVPTGLRVVVVVDDSIPLEDFRALVPRLQAALAADSLVRARAGTLQLAIVAPSDATAADGSAAVAYRRA
jgi:hypothetical protein